MQGETQRPCAELMLGQVALHIICVLQGHSARVHIYIWSNTSCLFTFLTLRAIAVSWAIQRRRALVMGVLCKGPRPWSCARAAMYGCRLAIDQSLACDLCRAECPSMCQHRGLAGEPVRQRQWERHGGAKAGTHGRILRGWAASGRGARLQCGHLGRSALAALQPIGA